MWHDTAHKFATMTRRRAHELLDAARCGAAIPPDDIVEALHATGDLPIRPHAADAFEETPQ